MKKSITGPMSRARAAPPAVSGQLFSIPHPESAVGKIDGLRVGKDLEGAVDGDDLPPVEAAEIEAFEARPARYQKDRLGGIKKW